MSDVSTMASWVSLSLLPAASLARYVLVLEESATLELVHAVVAAVVLTVCVGGFLLLVRHGCPC